MLVRDHRIPSSSDRPPPEPNDEMKSVASRVAAIGPHSGPYLAYNLVNRDCREPYRNTFRIFLCRHVNPSALIPKIPFALTRFRIMSFLRFRLRSLFMLITIVASLMAWRVSVVNRHERAVAYLLSRGFRLDLFEQTTFAPAWIDESHSIRRLINSLPEAIRKCILIDYCRFAYCDARELGKREKEVLTELYGVTQIIFYNIDEGCDLEFLDDVPELIGVVICQGELSNRQVQFLANMKLEGEVVSNQVELFQANTASRAKSFPTTDSPTSKPD